MDINCDLGESFGNWRLGADEALLPRISTASVACGFHGGDPRTMRETVEEAIRHDVAVGAHPGLPDLLGFGRRVMDVSPADLHAYITYQVGALKAFLALHGRELNHIKPHGALYPMLNARDDLAEATIRAMCELMAEPVLYWPAGSEDRALLRAARSAGVEVVGEFYPDSRYGANGETVLERHREPVDPDAAEAALRRFLADATIDTVEGTVIELSARSICIHGDGPTAVAIVDRVRSVLDELGYGLQPATKAEVVGA
ncbi:5-oxoprolinase subunit PxpA [Streptomyces sp. CA-106131]|uniref:5-oxoprolinase subunit PxpA n=1 Tax=Streptomyces sp. CA-106131 TaxID=3240045 RepID=UPI003D92DB9B